MNEDLISAALASIPQGKRGALLVLADEKGAHAQLAANINGNWTIATGIWCEWSKHPAPTAFVSIKGTW